MTKKLLSAAITAVAAITLMTATVFAAPSVSDTQEVISSDSTSEVTVNGKTATASLTVTVLPLTVHQKLLLMVRLLQLTML